VVVQDLPRDLGGLADLLANAGVHRGERRAGGAVVRVLGRGVPIHGET
jgi:hypothetical protein